MTPENRAIPGIPGSGVPGVLWPALPTVDTMATLALHEQLMHWQWWSAGRLRALRGRQLRMLLAYARNAVPHYAKLPKTDELAALPILTRGALQEDPARFAVSRMPREHLPVKTLRSSGSTGRPIEVRITRVTSLFRQALYLREHVWNARDFTLAAATIRNFRDGSGMPPNGKRAAGWGHGYATNPVAALNIRATVDEQLAWLERV